MVLTVLVYMIMFGWLGSLFLPSARTPYDLLSGTRVIPRASPGGQPGRPGTAVRRIFRHGTGEPGGILGKCAGASPASSVLP
ncbi:hypothetical protein [Sphaerisporangium perillae]|uniref:hypothetical protein n=1 Tax=Sphaerisporangium perillae TaxID=2935860 RepID=UPI00200E0E4D|nr:hypothetical protein [Sphaerisporangium perillae]